jgi:hypothetical protein
VPVVETLDDVVAPVDARDGQAGVRNDDRERQADVAAGTDDGDRARDGWVYRRPSKGANRRNSTESVGDDFMR